MKTQIYTHPCFLEHDTGPGHPERPDRLRVLLDLFGEPPFNTLPVVTAMEAQRSWITRAHPEFYVAKIESLIPDRGYAQADPDTVLSPGTWDAALHAAGAVCQAVDDVLSGTCTRAFCAVRPPGHHAGPAKAEGFCLFDNIFIGALHAQQKLGRVAILDFDVHHGNGTDALARAHDGVFFASSHEWPLYPGTGVPEDDIDGRIVNMTLSAGDGSREFRSAWSGRILPELDAFAPELIMISARFDAHRDDPLANINLTDDDFFWITAELSKLADRHCGGKIVSVLEGGYNLTALKSATSAHLKALAGLA